MRIFCLSDLHLEFSKTNKTGILLRLAALQPVADMLILAGDVGYPYPQDSPHAATYREFLIDCRKLYKHVLVVPGNHEYYAATAPTWACRNAVMQSLREICRDADVTLLQQNQITIAGIRFLGTTLWSDIQKPAFKAMNDSRYVFASHEEYLEAFRNDYQWLCRELAQPSPPLPTVIISHHLPTTRLIHPRFRDSLVNSGFATDLLEVMANQGLLKSVKFWFCGHSHERVTVSRPGWPLLVLNPWGYPSEDRQTEPDFETVFEVNE